MKKILTKFLPLLFLVSLTSCKQLLADIDETFSYWANTANITGIEIPSGVPVDKDGFFSLPSGEDAHIYFKLNNPQKFEFLMPGDSNAPADIIVFDENVKGKNGGRPEFGEEKDYSLTQKSSDTLELTYTKEFLLKNEQGKTDLNPKINLYNKKDKRKFEQNYNYKLRANTVPPKPEWFTTGKIQQGTDWYYVLIFKFEGLTNSTDIENFLHKDISEVYLTEGESQKAPIQVKLTKEGFDVSGSQGNLIPQDAAITALETQDIAGNLSFFKDIPNADDRKWMLCIKTGVKTGQSLSYKVKVKDLRGLASEETSGVTNVAKLPVPQISYDSGMGILISSGVYTDNETALSNGTYTNPILISSCFRKPVVLKAHNNDYPSGVTIEAEVKLSASTQAPSNFTGYKGRIQQDGNITKILLDPIPEVDEIYEVKLNASGPNYTDSDEKTYYYKIKKEVRAGTSSWQILKNAVAGAYAQDTIYINGHIISTDAADNSGEIEVKESIHIQGLNGKATDIINANKDGSNNPSPPHRIFKIKTGVTLNLTGLTIQNGKADIGGAILAETGSVLTLNNTDIKYSEASIGGGAISTGGTLIINGGSVISENEASQGGAIYNGGILKISGDAKITVDSAKNDVYLPTGKVITVTDALTEAYVARITPANNTYTPGRQVVEADSGVTLADQVSKFKVTNDPDGNKWKINDSGQLELANKTITVTSWGELKTEVEKTDGAELIIVDGTETNLTATASTDEINVNRNVTIIGKNSNITLNADEKCRIFKIDGNALLKLDNIKLTKGKVTSNGGGAIKILDGECIITNTVISNCEAKDGGAIDIDLKSGGEKAHCTLKTGTKIELCKATLAGGGVRISGDKTKTLLTMETGSSISLCTADTNGGAVWSKATFNMKGGSIEENTAGNSSANGDAQGSGGGVFNGKGGTFNMSGGKIIKNKAIVANSNSNDSSGNGGGVCIHKSNFTMTGGIIGGDENGEANIATKRGGGVFHNGNKFELSGSAKITPSIDPDENEHGKNDVYLFNNKTIKITGALAAGQNQAARITVPDANYTEGKVVLEGEGTVNLSNEAEKFKVTKKGTQNWYVDNDGKLTTTAPGP